uniref:Uncharacterized protein n=1 Tax=Nymphaea colorata TaxID=210225 RepID=A0A5K0Y4Q4_9MAGN
MQTDLVGRVYITRKKQTI